MGSVRTKTMMGTLSVGNWQAKVIDSKSARKTEEEAGAKIGTANASKNLFAGVSELKDVSNYATYLRNWWAGQTLPWFDGGPRVWAAERTMDLVMQVGDKTREFEDLAKAFCRKYQSLRAGRQFDMGTLFDEKEFPIPEAVEAKFYVRFDGPHALPDSEDIRVVEGIEESDLERFLAQARAAETAKVEDAMRDATSRLVKVLTKMHSVLDTPIPEKVKGQRPPPGTTFRDSFTENLAEIVGIMPQFNITGDVRLAKLIEQARKLTHYGPTDLREDADKRARAAGQAKELAGKLTGLFP